MSMDKDEYQSAVASCYVAAKLLIQHDLPEVITAINRADAVGPIVDPTLYRDKMQSMREDLTVVKAALALREIGLKMGAINAG